MANMLHVGAVVAMVWLVSLTVRKWVRLSAAHKSLANCPGGSTLLFHPFGALTLACAPFYPPRGFIGDYFGKFSVYKKYGSTILSSVVFTSSQSVYWLADGNAIKTVSSARMTFPKDAESYEPLNIYGKSVIGTEGPEWKRHRSVANPAFNEANNMLVWKETVRIIHDWFEAIDASEEKPRDLLHDLTLATLLVISSAGFGKHASFNEDFKAQPSKGHKMPFTAAITTAVGSVVVRGLTPGWISSLLRRIYIPVLTPVLRNIEDAVEATRLHMLEVVSLARAWIAEGEKANMDAALLRNLVQANMEHSNDSERKTLSDDELLSNTFNFLLAGHETTAHTLCFALVLLALHPDVQQKVYEEACRLWPNGVRPLETSTAYKESMSQLVFTWAVLHETLRLFPPAARLSKHVTKDTSLQARRFSTDLTGEPVNVQEYTVDLKAGDMVIIDMIALHMNPIHWGNDAAEFKPERFIDTDTYRWPREGFNAFAQGPRSCIGQRFAVTEALCILAHLMRRYEILVPDELMGKTHEELKDIMLQWSAGLTITPKNVRVRLRRRHA